MADDDEAAAAKRAKEIEDEAHRKAAAAEEHAARLREIDEKFAAHKADLQKELSELGAADQAEKAQLRQELDELKEWKEQAVKDAAEKEKHKNDSSTMVVPPSDLPQQHSGSREGDIAQPTHPSGGDHDAGARKGGWRRFW